VAVGLPALGFKYSTNQLFWLAAAPALSGATLRIFYSFIVPVVGGRRWTAISTASLMIPAAGIGFAVQDNTTTYPTMLMLALLCGFGGGNFSSSMSNISFFFPKERKGSALGVNAGLGNLGVKVPDTGSASDPDALAGKLTFDQKAFDAAWAAGPSAVKAKLGSLGQSGFSQKFEAILDPITRAGDGLLDLRVKDGDRQLSGVKDKLGRMDDRLQSKQDYLRKQFAALEEALSRSQAQSSDLASQLAQLS